VGAAKSIRRRRKVSQRLTNVKESEDSRREPRSRKKWARWRLKRERRGESKVSRQQGGLIKRRATVREELWRGQSLCRLLRLLGDCTNLPTLISYWYIMVILLEFIRNLIMIKSIISTFST
jgi:hypothetical protein